MNVAEAFGMGPARTETELDDGSWVISIRPPAWVGTYPTVYVKLNQLQYINYRKWRDNEAVSIQEALPDLSAHERELLMHGIDLSD